MPLPVVGLATSFGNKHDKAQSQFKGIYAIFEFVIGRTRTDYPLVD